MRLRGRSVWLDYLSYRFWLDTVGSVMFLGGLVLLVLALYLSRNEWAALPGLVLVVSGLQHAVDVRHHADGIARFFGRPSRRFRRQPRVCIAKQQHSLADFGPSQKESEDGFSQRKFGADAVLYSRAVNDWLASADPSILLDGSKNAAVGSLIRSKREKLAELLALKFYESRTDGKDFRNERKLCLASDIGPTIQQVRCAVIGYYDAFLTNEAPLLSIYEQSTGIEIKEFGDLFPAEVDASGILRMKSLEASQCANAVGVSTLAFTNDGYMVLWEQSEVAQQSEGCLAPSGSGSLDSTDLRAASLKDTLTHGMERELREECSEKGTILDGREVGATKLIAYFRWLRRGGKPEFCGISRVYKRKAEVKPDHSEVHDGIDRSLFYPARDADQTLASISSLRVAGNLSTPLAVTLLALEAFVKGNRKEFEEFLAMTSNTR